MRFGMPLLDLLPTHRRRRRLPHRLVVIGMLIKYVKFWKAKLCYVLSMWSLLLLLLPPLLLLLRRLVHHLHHLNGRVSRRGLHWFNRYLQWHPHHRLHQMCRMLQKRGVVHRRYVISWKRA